MRHIVILAVPYCINFFGPGGFSTSFLLKKEIAYFAQTRKRYWFIILLVFSALNYGYNAVPKVFLVG